MHFSNKAAVFFYFYYVESLIDLNNYSNGTQVHHAALSHLEMSLKAVSLFYLLSDWIFMELLPWLCWHELLRKKIFLLKNLFAASLNCPPSFEFSTPNKYATKN